MYSNSKALIFGVYDAQKDEMYPLWFKHQHSEDELRHTLCQWASMVSMRVLWRMGDVVHHKWDDVTKPINGVVIDYGYKAIPNLRYYVQVVDSLPSDWFVPSPKIAHIYDTLDTAPIVRSSSSLVMEILHRQREKEAEQILAGESPHYLVGVRQS
jgi:hypothetical protein